MTIERWTKEKTEDNANIWEESSSGKERAGQKIRGGLQAATWAQGGGASLRTQGGSGTSQPDKGGGAKG